MKASLPRRSPGTAPRPSTVEASVRALIAREAAGVTAVEHARSAARVCAVLSDHLSRLVGTGGVRALFERSVVLTEASFPSLHGPLSQATEPPWAALLDRASRATDDVALDASTELVTTFLTSLARLIGAGLVARLIREIWPDDFPASEDEETP